MKNYEEAKKHPSRIGVLSIMLLFTMCLTINVLFCNNYNPYELLNKTTITETRTISESIAASKNGDNTTFFKPYFLNKDNTYTETITKNICPTPMTASIPIGFSLFIFLIIDFLYFFFTLFILLPDGWTLINQKVRLDN